jgi:hypothetical protein
MNTMLAAIKAYCPTQSGARPYELAFKAVDAEEGLLIFKVATAGNFDRERERIKLHALKAATYELVRNIGADDADRRCAVDINHAEKAIPCDIVMAWAGYPMPDENACYVALRPHDRAIVDAAKAGHVVGASWSGPYRLKDAEF